MPVNDYSTSQSFSLAFSKTAGGFSIGGNSSLLTTGGTSTDSSGLIQIFGAPLMLQGTHKFQIGNNAQCVLAGILSGSGSLVKAGAGDLSLSTAVNSYAGTTVIHAGSLTVDADSRLGVVPGVFTAGNIVIDGGILRACGGFVLNGNRGFTLGSSAGSGGSVDVSAGTLAYAGVFADSAGGNSLTKTGQGSLALSGANTFTGGVVVTQGTLSVDFSQSSLSSGILSTSGGITLGGFPVSGSVLASPYSSPTLLVTGKAATSNSQMAGGIVVGPGASSVTANVGAGGAMALSLGALTRTPGGNINFSGTGTIAASATLVNGIVGGWATYGNTDWATISAGNVIALPAGGYTIPTGANPVLQSSTVSNVKLDSTSNGNVSVTAGQTTDVNSILLSDTATRTVALASNATILRFGTQGGVFRTALSNSQLVLGDTVGVGVLTAGGAANGAGELTLNANGATFGNTAITVNAAIRDNGSGAVRLVRTGVAQVVLAGSNTHSGGTFLVNGRTELNGAAASLGSGTVTIFPGAQLWANASVSSLTNAFEVSGAGIQESSGEGALRLNGQTLSGPINVHGDTRLASGTGTLSGAITGSGNVEFGATGTVSGTLILNSPAGGNSWPGTTTFQSNNTTVSLGANEQLPNGANAGNFILIGGSATTAVLDLNSMNETINGLVSSGVAANAIVTNNNAGSGTSVLMLGDNDATAVFAGVIKDGATAHVALTKIGLGTQVLAGTNAYSGPTTVSGGKLSVGADANLGNVPNIATPRNIVLNGGALGVSTSFVLSSVRGIAMGPQTGAGSGSIDVDAGAILSYSGVIANAGSGPGGLVKNGNGTLSLSGANSYSGPTVVNAGALQVGNTLSGAVTVADGAALNPGPANVPGTLTLSAPGVALALAGTSAMTFRLNGAPGLTPATGNDYLAISNGNAVLGGVLNLTGDLNVGAASGVYRLIDLSAGTGTFSGGLTIGSVPAGITATLKPDTVNFKFVDVLLTVQSSPKTWIGRGNSPNWSLGSNWIGGLAPSNGADLIFPSGASQNNTTDDLGAGGSFNSISITAGGYALTGGPVALTSGGTSLAVAATSGTTSLNLALTVTGSVVSSTPGGSLTLGAANTIGGGIRVDDGTLICGATQSVSGGLTLGAMPGTLSVPSLDLTNGSATFGGPLAVQYDSATGGNILVGSGKILTVNAGVTIGYPAAANNRPTKVTVSGAGSLVVNASAAIFQVGGQNVSSATNSNSATLDMNALNTFSATVRTFRIGDANDSAGAAQAAGLSTVILAAHSSITATNLEVGDDGYQATHVLKLGSISNTFNVSSFDIGTSGSAGGSVTFNTGTGTLTVRDISGTGRALMNVAGGGSQAAVNISDNFDTTGHFADLLLDSLTLTDQARHAVLTTTFSFDQGMLDVTTLNLSRRSPYQPDTHNFNTTLTLGGGTINVGSGGITLVNSAAPAIDSHALNGSLIINGGTVSVNGDVLKVVSNTGPSKATLTLNGGTLDMHGHNLGGTVPIDVLNMQSGTLKNVGQIAGGGLVKTGAGVLLLGGANTWTGSTQINTGTLRCTNANCLSGASALVLANASGVTLDLNGFDQSAGSLAGGGATGGAVTLGSVTLSVGGDNSATNFAGAISGNGTVLKTGGGMWTFSASQPWTGAFNVNGGGVTVVSACQLSASTVNVNNGAEIFYNGSGPALPVKVSGSSAGSPASAGSQLRGVGIVGVITATDPAGNGVVWPGTTSLASSLTASEALTGTSANFSQGGKLAIAMNPTSAPAATQALLLSGNLTLDSTSTLALAFPSIAGNASASLVIVSTGTGGISTPFSKVLFGPGYAYPNSTIRLKYDDTTHQNPNAPAINPTAANPLIGTFNQISVVFNGTDVSPIKLDSFTAAAQGLGVLLEWNAVSEFRNVGFHVERRWEGAAGWTRVNSTLIPGRITSADTKLYRFYDWTPLGSFEYRLISVSLEGVEEVYAQGAGPVANSWFGIKPLNAAGVGAAAEDAAAVANTTNVFVRPEVGTFGNPSASTHVRDWSTILEKSEVGPQPLLHQVKTSAASNAAAAPPISAAARWFTSSRPGGGSSVAAKVVYVQPGVLAISQAALPTGFDIHQVAIQREGRSIPALAIIGQTLFVYAPGYDDDYTDKDALFLRAISGNTAVSNATAATGLFANPGLVNTFVPASVTASYHDVYFDFSPAYRPLTFAPWFSDKYLSGGSTQTFDLATPFASGASATLTVDLWSLSSAPVTPDHALQVAINDRELGEITWSGGGKMLQLTFDIPANILTSGDNRIRLISPIIDGVPSEISFLYSLRIDYVRSLNGSKPLTIANEAHQPQMYELSQVESAAPWIVDARFPDRAALAPFESQAQGDGTFKIRFIAQPGGSGQYLFTPAGLENMPLSLSRRVLSPVRGPRKYLAVGPSQFSPGVQPLLALRSKQGLRAEFIDQESIFDYYGYGRYGPAPIQSAVRSLRPQYLLLLGRTTYDYRNYSGANVDPLCPAFLVSTTFWAQTTSDSLFGDLGRGCPEVAIGRLPVNDTADLAGAVGHILNYKGFPASGISGQITADAADPAAGDFAALSDGVIAANPDFAWSRNYLGVNRQSTADAGAAMTAAANGAANLLLYVGHGNALGLGNETPRILDVASVQQWTGNTVFLQSTCTANWMAKNVPDYHSVAIQALTQPQGGIAASIGTSTYMTSEAAVNFMTRLIANANVNGTRWGDALKKTQQWASNQGSDGIQADLSRTEQLFGDPAMPVFSNSKSGE